MMNKILLFILLLFPFITSGQILTDGGGNIIASPYKYFTNDVANLSLESGAYTNDNADGYDIMKCTSDGVAYFNSTQAYGEWYFTTLASTSAKNNITYIIYKNSDNGYYYRQLNSRMYLYKKIDNSDIFMFYSANIFPAVYSYNIKITRSDIGTFTTYYKKSTEFFYKKIPVAGGANPVTENTITTSTQFRIDYESNQWISNIKFKDDYKTIIK